MLYSRAAQAGSFYSCTKWLAWRSLYIIVASLPIGELRYGMDHCGARMQDACRAFARQQQRTRFTFSKEPTLVSIQVNAL